MTWELYVSSWPEEKARPVGFITAVLPSHVPKFRMPFQLRPVDNGQWTDTYHNFSLHHDKVNDLRDSGFANHAFPGVVWNVDWLLEQPFSTPNVPKRDRLVKLSLPQFLESPPHIAVVIKHSSRTAPVTFYHIHQRDFEALQPYTSLPWLPSFRSSIFLTLLINIFPALAFLFASSLLQTSPNWTTSKLSAS
jgi:hypothetical protein